MNRTWAWAMWLLWLICFQFSLLLFYWLQTSVQTVSMAWGAEQTILCLLACGFYFIMVYLRWQTLDKMKQQPAKQFRIFAWALMLGLLPVLLVYIQIPPVTSVVGNGIAILGVLCLLQLAPSYATPGYDFESEKNTK